MAATSAVLGLLRPGETVVLPADSYYLNRVLATGYFSQMGVKVRMAPTAGNAQAEALDGAKLLWLESPSNPGLEVCDVSALCQVAHRKGVLVALDNTTPTVLGQRPLELGADFSVASDTKALTGHSDLLMGHVAVKDTEWLTRLHTWRTQMGAVPGPMEVWLAHRSLATLEVRLERMCSNALQVAEFMRQHPKVQAVRYPGLPTDPSHAIARTQMRRFGPVLSFTLDNAAVAQRFLSACQLVHEATSFGGVHTSAERRGRWGGDAVPEGYIRMSVGLEGAEDLIADLEQALAQTP
jgi:cystathionine gamma-lyase